jgi:iron complex outermembrane receptor protein
MRTPLSFGTGFGVCACAFGLAIAAAPPAQAAEVMQDGGDLSGLSIEELANIEVRSASKHEEPLSGVARALYVLTGEDIERSGVTSLPEALRLAPNLSVQQLDASQYAISARGFNGLEAGNKVLALIDGRTIYTPLGSSVLWNLHSPLLEDLQQIEVISGPGGTLYGPNAVNGVINITTRDAQDTLGTLVRGTVGGEERTAAVRQGFALGSSGAVRVYANAFDRDGLPGGLGRDYDDDYRGVQAGFRSDFVTDTDHLTLQGDIFRNDADTASGDGAKGHNLLGRWSRTLTPTSSFRLQAYYDSFKRDFTLVDDSVDTFDAEGLVNLSRGKHEIVAGAGVRTTKDEFINALNVFNLDPTSRRLWVYNLFAQDRFHVSDTLSLIAGVKVERSTFTGWQILPNARLAWQPNDKTLLWAAVSRAVRTPSRIDRNLEALPILAQSPDFDSEKLIAIEGGYRGQPLERLTLSVNGFVNFYDDIRTTEPTNGGLPFQLRNGIKGRSYGIEAWGTAQVAPWWRLSLGTATLWKNFDVKEGHTNLIPRNSLGNDPEWQIKGRSQFQIAPRLALEVNARAIGEIDQAPEIDSYVEAGGRLAYQATDQIELYVAGRNLLHETHIEYNDAGAGQAAERSIVAGTRLRF